ncbi:hypothetical protein SEEH2823_05632 [Salmonella enterica subsp. enterica serovar Heidelberg str. 77-2823]|nr:hypothetical protein SEEH2823_05632 [Salmonella enterica subsp. enterica serovar Heidelberg str. 77-2823]
MYIHGIVIDPSSRFSGGLAIFNKMCYFIFVTHQAKSRYFLCDAPGVLFIKLIFKLALAVRANKIFLTLKG